MKLLSFYLLKLIPLRFNFSATVAFKFCMDRHTVLRNLPRKSNTHWKSKRPHYGGVKKTPRWTSLLKISTQWRYYPRSVVRSTDSYLLCSSQILRFLHVGHFSLLSLSFARTSCQLVTKSSRVLVGSYTWAKSSTDPVNSDYSVDFSRNIVSPWIQLMRRYITQHVAS